MYCYRAGTSTSETGYRVSTRLSPGLGVVFFVRVRLRDTKCLYDIRILPGRRRIFGHRDPDIIIARVVLQYDRAAHVCVLTHGFTEYSHKRTAARTQEEEEEKKRNRIKKENNHPPGRFE